MSDDENRARDAIASDLEENLGSLLGLDPGTPIDRKRRLEAMGLDSLLAMDLILALEKRYGKLPETLVRDHPSIQLLTDFLYRKQQGG